MMTLHIVSCSVSGIEVVIPGQPLPLSLSCIKLYTKDYICATSLVFHIHLSFVYHVYTLGSFKVSYFPPPG